MTCKLLRYHPGCNRPARNFPNDAARHNDISIYSKIILAAVLVTTTRWSLRGHPFGWVRLSSILTRTMSRIQATRGILHCGRSHKPIPAGIALPPSFLSPSIAKTTGSSKRTFITRRSAHSHAQTSFYAPSFPPHPTPSNLVPNADANGEIEDEDTSAGCSHAEGSNPGRKHPSIESLMDKAGELSLRCKYMESSFACFVVFGPWGRLLIHRVGSILDAQGNWTAEEGRYKKSELCREYDLDVSRYLSTSRKCTDADASLAICGNSIL